jgi:hypothetical protein
MRKGCIVNCGSEMVSIVEDGCKALGLRITARRDIFELDAIELRIEGDSLPDEYAVSPGSYFARKDMREDDPFWKRFLENAICSQTYPAKCVHAEIGNVEIHADAHGMGFTCSVNGQPIKRLRAVTLTLGLEQPNLVTVQFLPDHTHL